MWSRSSSGFKEMIYGYIKIEFMVNNNKMKTGPFNICRRINSIFYIYIRFCLNRFRIEWINRIVSSYKCVISAPKAVTFSFSETVIYRVKLIWPRCSYQCIQIANTVYAYLHIESMIIFVWTKTSDCVYWIASIPCGFIDKFD